MAAIRIVAGIARQPSVHGTAGVLKHFKFLHGLGHVDADGEFAQPGDARGELQEFGPGGVGGVRRKGGPLVRMAEGLDGLEASARISLGGRPDLMPVISRKEITRSGVESQTSGSSSGRISISATVVVPVRSNCWAPWSQEWAKSE